VRHQLKIIRHYNLLSDIVLVHVVCPVSEISVPVPWGQIRGKAWGPDHGRPVLCLHGWADNCGTFNTLIPLLPKDCRYVAVDMPGHGLSSHRPPGVFYSFPAYVADVRRIVDGLQWMRFSIIGHSMGESHMIALYPEMVDAVVLLDALGFIPTDLTEIPKVMRQGMDEMLQYEKKTEEKKRVYTYEKAAERLSAANPTLSEQSVNILLERGLVQLEGGASLSLLLLSERSNLSLLSHICCQLKVADKGFCVTFPDSDQQKVASRLLQGYHDRNVMVSVPGDHHVHLNNPEVVAPLVSEFLGHKHAHTHTHTCTRTHTHTHTQTHFKCTVLKKYLTLLLIMFFQSSCVTI
uniref:Serine hydrolase like n=1 Tax=Sparus aurata TaxID=8175 RepID=A0A671YHP6_SPAAU